MTGGDNRMESTLHKKLISENQQPINNEVVTNWHDVDWALTHEFVEK